MLVLKWCHAHEAFGRDPGRCSEMLVLVGDGPSQEQADNHACTEVSFTRLNLQMA